MAINPGDIIRFNPVYTERDNGLVSLTGEFRRPGFYDISRGERLSQLIARAGGLTEEAYPYGAVFTRTSVRDEEARQYQKAAEQLQSGLPTALAARVKQRPVASSRRGGPADHHSDQIDASRRASRD